MLIVHSQPSPWLFLLCVGILSEVYCMYISNLHSCNQTWRIKQARTTDACNTVLTVYIASYSIIRFVCILKGYLGEAWEGGHANSLWSSPSTVGSIFVRQSKQLLMEVAQFAELAIIAAFIPCTVKGYTVEPLYSGHTWARKYWPDNWGGHISGVHMCM